MRGKKRRSFGVLLEDFKQSWCRVAKWEELFQDFTVMEVIELCSLHLESEVIDILNTSAFFRLKLNNFVRCKQKLKMRSDNTYYSLSILNNATLQAAVTIPLSYCPPLPTCRHQKLHYSF